MLSTLFQHGEKKLLHVDSHICLCFKKTILFLVNVFSLDFKGDLMVKMYTKDGREITFDGRSVENDLIAAGLPKRLAEEVAERVQKNVKDGWTTEKVRQEIDAQLRRLEDDIDKAHVNFECATPLADHSVGEKRASTEEYPPNVKPRSERKVTLKA